MRTVCGTNRRTFLDLIDRQIKRGENTRIALGTLHCRHDIRRNRTGIERIRSTGRDCPQGLSISVIGQGIPHLQGCATRQEIGRRVRKARQAFLISLNQTRKARGDGKTSIRKINGVVKQPSPGLVAPALMQRL